MSHWPIRAGGFQTEIMLTGEHQSCEGIIKINCRPLEQSQLRKLDKNEKILAITLSGVSKGNFPNHYDAQINNVWYPQLSSVFTGIFNLFLNTCVWELQLNASKLYHEQTVINKESLSILMIKWLTQTTLHVPDKYSFWTFMPLVIDIYLILPNKLAT